MFDSTVPWVAERIHAAAVSCSDGRWGRQIDEFLEKGLALPRYDRVAVPGGAGALAGHVLTWKEEGALEHQLDLLVQVHGLVRVVLIAHQDCAFYTDRLKIAGHELAAVQRRDLVVAAHRISNLHPEVAVESYFACREGERARFVEWPDAWKTARSPSSGSRPA
jgi:hypothetical protein